MTESKEICQESRESHPQFVSEATVDATQTQQTSDNEERHGDMSIISLSVTTRNQRVTKTTKATAAIIAHISAQPSITFPTRVSRQVLNDRASFSIIS